MRAERTPWFRCACCPPNVMRTLASLEHYVVAADDTSVVLHQYIPGNFEARIGAGTVRLDVQTGLPWDGLGRDRGGRPGRVSRGRSCFACRRGRRRPEQPSPGRTSATSRGTAGCG